ncbi:MAG: hypothetical protein WD766_12910 [Gemmatimonadota bacterium]
MGRMNQTIAASFMSIALVILISAPASAQTRDRIPTNPDVITAAEIPEGRYASAFEVVRGMRPGWLRPRANYTPSSSSSPMMVLVDNVQRGTVETLESINPDEIERIEWVDASTATQRWGTGHALGAIVVTTRRGL